MGTKFDQSSLQRNVSKTGMVQEFICHDLNVPFSSQYSFAILGFNARNSGGGGPMAAMSSVKCGQSSECECGLDP